MQIWSSARTRLTELDLSIPVIAIFVIGVFFFNSSRPTQTKSPVEYLSVLSGERVDLTKAVSGTVLIFWATWCPPCKLELARVQRMINAGEIDKNSVIAVSSLEDRKIIEETIRDRGYSFPVVQDLDGSLKDKFQVSATPTIYLIRPNLEITWATAGVSPTLEYRISSFLRANKRQ